MKSKFTPEQLLYDDMYAYCMGVSALEEYVIIANIYAEEEEIMAFMLDELLAITNLGIWDILTTDKRFTAVGSRNFIRSIADYRKNWGRLSIKQESWVGIYYMRYMKYLHKSDTSGKDILQNEFHVKF